VIVQEPYYGNAGFWLAHVYV